MTDERKIHYIKRKRYWRMPQSQAITPDMGSYSGDACAGCALATLRTDDEPCPEHKDKRLANSTPVICQDYELDIETRFSDGTYDDYVVLKDYIFIPATRVGMAAYVAHLLESA